MRVFIGFLGLIMFILICNTLAYVISEDYRFFLKKLKYQEEVVYDEEVQVDDTERVTVVEDESGTPTVSIEQEGVTFLEALSGERPEVEEEEDTILELNEDELALIDGFKEVYVLSERPAPASLFGITTEYPDEYYEFYNRHLSLYVFPTKTYEEVQNIFQVLEFELPYTLNEVNNFGEASFFINLDDGFADGNVRIVLQYKNRAFGLKIKKDNYNRAKEILQNF